jgi:hypothetical protein
MRLLTPTDSRLAAFVRRLKVRILNAAIAVALLSSGTVMAEKPAKLDRSDPNAVRCKSLKVTGSLVKRERICRTNAEWRASSDQENRDAENLIERSRSGMNPNG